MALKTFAEEHYPLPLSVKSNPSNKENWIWIDVEDIEVEEVFRDTAGEQVTWFNWGTDQPDNRYPRRGGQDRVGMNKNTGKWFDVFEERRFQFVCQERVWQCASKDLAPTEQVVTVPPTEGSDLEFISRPSSYMANLGSKVTFTSSFLPDTANVRWSMGGKIVTGRNKDQDRVYQDEEGRLIVQEVQEQDGGVVSCILFTDRHELIANSALKIVEEKLLAYVKMNEEEGETFLEATTICMAMGGSVAVPEDEAGNIAIAQLVKNSNVWLGIKRSESGDYVRQDDDSSVIEYSNWGAGEPAVLEESSGVVLNADETSEELGSWYTRAVTERHATVCERVPRKINSKRRVRV